MLNCLRAALSLCLMSGFAGLVQKLWLWVGAVPSPRRVIPIFILLMNSSQILLNVTRPKHLGRNP